MSREYTDCLLVSGRVRYLSAGYQHRAVTATPGTHAFSEHFQTMSPSRLSYLNGVVLCHVTLFWGNEILYCDVRRGRSLRVMLADPCRLIPSLALAA